MNTIQRFIPFYNLATGKSGYTLDAELLKTRELIIFGIATVAFTSLALTYLNLNGNFTFNITLLNTGIFSGVILASLMFSERISSKFYEWDKTRAVNEIIKNRFDSLERNHKGSYNWLVHHDDAISMIKEHDVSFKVLKKMLTFAIKYKKNTLIDFLWDKIPSTEKKGFVVELYCQEKNPHPKLLKWLLNNIEALKLLLDEKGVDLCKLSSARNPENILITAILKDNCEAFNLLLNYIASDDIKIRNFFLKDAINMIVPNFDCDWDYDNVSNNNLILSFSKEFEGNTIEELKLLLLKKFPSINENNCSEEDESGAEQLHELFDIITGLRRIDSKKLYSKVAYRLSYENDNTLIPEFLLINKMVQAAQFNKNEQKSILVQCLNPFKPKFVKIVNLSGMMDGITHAWIQKPKAAAFYKKIPKKLKHTAFSLRIDYDQYLDIWVERLVNLGFDLGAKGPYTNAEWVFKNFDVENILQGEIETDGFLKGAHLENFNNGIKSRCDFITNLRKKIFLERLPLIHYAMTENVVGDVAGQIFNFYNILSLTPLKS